MALGTLITHLRMLVARARTAKVPHNSDVIVAGGKGEDTIVVLDDIEVLNIIDSKWECSYLNQCGEFQPQPQQNRFTLWGITEQTITAVMMPTLLLLIASLMH